MDSPLVVVLLSVGASPRANLLTAAIPNVEKLPVGIASLFLDPAHREAFRDKWASRLASKRITAIGILIWAMKPRKPNAARKPPMPSDSHADIEDWMRRVMPDLHPIVKRLDEMIC